MELGDFNREIVAAWGVAKRLGFERSVGTLTSMNVDEDHRRIVLDPRSTYEAIYKSAASRAAYNFMMKDYAIFQFSWSGESEWRLAFLPNPWLTGVPSSLAELEALERHVESGRLQHDDADSLLEALPYHGAVPPIRFEYSRRQYREVVHPAAHFHIGRDGENRWASGVVLGPRVFMLLMMRLYYPDRWRLCSRIYGAELGACLDEEMQRLVDDARMSPDFTALERRAIHLGRAIGAG